VWGSLGPLAVGHAVAIAAALALAAMIGEMIPMSLLRTLVGGGLVLRGTVMVVRHSHPRGGGMLVSAGGLAWWSFLMASAHGAGLMALPIVWSSQATPRVAGSFHGLHQVHNVVQASLGPQLSVSTIAATTAHVVGYLLVSGLLATVVYEHLGVKVLRSAWINIDLLWASALVVTGVATFL
jgi:hypothetical protein